jgi:hypothetical protein
MLVLPWDRFLCANAAGVLAILCAQLAVGGMTCGACSAAVEKAIKGVPGALCNKNGHAPHAAVHSVACGQGDVGPLFQRRVWHCASQRSLQAKSHATGSGRTHGAAHFVLRGPSFAAALTLFFIFQNMARAPQAFFPPRWRSWPTRRWSCWMRHARRTRRYCPLSRTLALRPCCCLLRMWLPPPLRQQHHRAALRCILRA